MIRVPRTPWTADNATDEQLRLAREAIDKARNVDHQTSEMWAAIAKAHAAGVSIDWLAEQTGRSRPTYYRRLEKLARWWRNLSKADRDLFLAHRDAQELPADVVRRLVDTGQLVAGGKWEDQPGWTFYWPADISELLAREAGDED